MKTPNDISRIDEDLFQGKTSQLQRITYNYYQLLLTRAGLIVLFPSRGCGSAEGGRENLQDEGGFFHVAMAERHPQKC